jgi:HD-like signal output (HDOD) protein
MIDQRTQVRITRFIQNMPPLPITVSKILEVTKKPNVDAKELNSIISLDPVLTGKVLKLINSAYYSLPNQITSIVRAIVMLGINTVKNLALSTGIVTTINEKKNFSALDMDGFWRHSICVGVMAKLFAKKQNVDPKNQEEYFVAGLLHDIGKIPLNSQLADSYVKTMTYARQQKLPLYQVETRAFGINHSDIGFQIAEVWRLNKNLTASIKCHHTIMNTTEVTDEEQKKFIATVALANMITNKAEIGFSGDKFPDQKEEDLFSMIGLNWTNIEEAEATAEEAIKKAEIFLQLS